VLVEYVGAEGSAMTVAVSSFALANDKGPNARSGLALFRLLVARLLTWR
jgi:hypothetical protein